MIPKRVAALVESQRGALAPKAAELWRGAYIAEPGACIGMRRQAVISRFVQCCLYYRKAQCIDSLCIRVASASHPGQSTEFGVGQASWRTNCSAGRHTCRLVSLACHATAASCVLGRSLRMRTRCCDGACMPASLAHSPQPKLNLWFFRRHCHCRTHLATSRTLLVGVQSLKHHATHF